MSDAPPKRRLPVLQTRAAGDDDAGEERPAWHFTVVGAVMAILVWLPLAAAASSAATRLAGDPGPDGAVPVHLAPALIGLGALGYATASFAAGALVGRFGGRAGLREATLTGPIAGAVAWALAATQSGPGPGAIAWALLLVTMAAVGAGASHGGGRAGLAARATSRP